MEKKKEKTYLVFLEQCDDKTLIKRLTGKQIREDVEELNKRYNAGNNQLGMAIVEGNLLKNFDNTIDLSKL